MSCPATSTASATSASSPAATASRSSPSAAACSICLHPSPPSLLPTIMTCSSSLPELPCSSARPVAEGRLFVVGLFEPGESPPAGGLLMITARWTPPRPLQRQPPRSTGEPVSFRTPQARLPAPSRPPQHPEPLRKRLSPRQYPPIPPSWARADRPADPGPAMQCP